MRQEKIPIQKLISLTGVTYVKGTASCRLLFHPTKSPVAVYIVNITLKCAANSHYLQIQSNMCKQTQVTVILFSSTTRGAAHIFSSVTEPLSILVSFTYGIWHGNT